MNKIAALWWQVLLLLVAASIAYWVWSTDWFQKLAFPRDYWGKQTEGQQFTVTLYSKNLASCRLDLEKFQRTADLEVQKEELNRGPETDYPETPQAAVRRKHETMVQRCQAVEELLGHAQVELEKARSELIKARGQ